MRIEGVGRMAGGPSATRQTGSAGGFRLADAGASSPTQTAAPLRSAPGLDALIALQAIPQENQREKRRREIKRGRGLLDALDGMKLALLDGRDDPATLSRLAAGLRERRGDTGDAGLDDALSAIELRVAVEIAKRGG